MQRLLINLLAVAGVTLTSSLAFSADMPTKAPAYAPVASMYNWGGAYIGVNAGGAWNRSSGGVGSSNQGGFIGGGQLGYNWQFGQVVLGLEADFQGADQRSDFTGVGFTGSTRIDYFGTVRARLGYAWDRWMVYGTGGYAYVNVRDSLTAGGLTSSSNTTLSGGTIGGGVEWAFWQRWSAKVEYLYISTRSDNLTTGAFTMDGRVRENVVRVGLNYHF